MRRFRVLLVVFVIISSVVCEDARRFPKDIKFGVSTAAYQIEGAWNVSDKGVNIWDYTFHNKTYHVISGDTGDIACDSYHKYKRDVEMLVELGVDYYRFSISWTRILPDGFAHYISRDGIKYYNNLIDELLVHNITPAITLYHWDLPQRLQDLGGWVNPLMAEYYLRYADVVFNAFGDRVKLWVTFNEPWVICHKGYGEKHMAPALGMRGIGDYLCGHIVLKAHADVYHMYNRKYKPTQKGKLSIALNSAWHEPESDTQDALARAETGMEFELGWFANPIYSNEGDYPKVMKDNIANKSLEQGYPYSRLPEFTSQEIKYIRGTYDFFGYNHYTSVLSGIREPNSQTHSYRDDIGLNEYQNQTWIASETGWLKAAPWGFRKALNWIKTKYGNPEILVLENGFSDKGELQDDGRIAFYNDYLNSMLDAIEDGCNVTAYMAWSFMDNFEWFYGFRQKFGFYSVDFKDPDRKRTPKASLSYFKGVTKSRTIRRKL